MITPDQFESIKRRHGDYASWAVWAQAEKSPKSNMGDMSILNLKANPTLLKTLKTNVIMVALNFSRPTVQNEAFRNFHDSNPWANDFKIRFAFQRTQYYGAYMTDIIKNLVEVDSSKVLELLKKKPELIKENVKLFRKELEDLKTNAPTILAFGISTYNIIKEHIKAEEYTRLIKLTHYSHQISKENYRVQVLNQLRQTSA